MTPAPVHRCPLCGGPNACAPAETGSFTTACWCRTVVVPASLIARLPEGALGVACLCRKCVLGATPPEA